MHLPLQRTGSLDEHRTLGAHAVVLGAGMGGLLAARVLADHFERITVVERDLLPDEARPRRGVPQAPHVHLLLPRGGRLMEDLFPGLLAELSEAGVPFSRDLGSVYFKVNGHTFFHSAEAEGARRSVDQVALCAPSRPFLESKVLRRVRSLPNVEVLDGWEVAGLMTDERLTRVTGARIASRDASVVQRGLPADLVVVATGRSSRTGAWLRAMGYAPPPEEVLAIDLKYVTQQVRFPEGSMDPVTALEVGPTPERPTGVGACARESGTWVVTMAGYAGHHPPMRREAWLEFGEQFLPREYAVALRAAEPVGDLHQHRFSANVRRRFDKLDRFPRGLLATGDALCSFNPIYGQGMTVAGIEALAMGEVLRQGEDDVAARFFKAVAKPIGEAWRFATGGDLAMPPEIVPGPRPLPFRAVNSYIDRVMTAAEEDPVMAWRFFDVTGLDAPTAALFTPDSLRRVVSHSRPGRRTASAAAGTRGGLGSDWP
jgi:2-polyprenyl-6-methoxyphenol hydroxylase-like FAD-dependent oxidoreductase